MSQGTYSVIIHAGDNYSVAGTDTVVPTLNFNGILHVELVVNDGTDDSDPYSVDVTVTPINDEPVITKIPDQNIALGDTFLIVPLDTFVTDVETLDSLIAWTINGNSELLVQIVDRVAIITVPEASWTGSDTIIFTATDDDASNPLSKSDTAVFTVTDENTAPIVGDIPNQTITAEGVFEPIMLYNYVDDLETPDSDIEWEVVGCSNLEISITDGVASIEVTDDSWVGSETVIFAAIDDCMIPLMDYDEVTFTVEPVALNLSAYNLLIKTYPNPSSGYITIEFSEELNFGMRIHVINSQGQIMQNTEFELIRKKVDLDLGNLPAGIYYIEILADDIRKDSQSFLKGRNINWNIEKPGTIVRLFL